MVESINYKDINDGDDDTMFTHIKYSPHLKFLKILLVIY